MIAEAKADEIAPVMAILFFVLIAGGYTFAENKKLDNLSDESISCMDQENLKQYIYRKNTLIGVYAIIFSISAGLLYICVCDFVDENILVLIFRFRICS